jgi:DNA-binding NarL/FixJ family response regulator
MLSSLEETTTSIPAAPAPVIRPANEDFLAKLTPAERLVAVLVRQGLSNKEIADSLGKATCTVKAQVASILHKYGVPSRTRLLALWMAEGHVRIKAR